MKKNHFNIGFSKIFPFIVFVGLVGCQFQGNKSYSFPSPTIFSSWEPNQIPLTLTASVIPSKSPTNTIILTETSTPVFLPPPGEYIAYSTDPSDQSVQLVSMTGQEVGKLMEGGGWHRTWVSPKQDIIAYMETTHIIQFRYIYTGEIITIMDQEGCKFWGTDLAWNPKGDRIILTCVNDDNKNDLKIFTFPEGNIIGQIEKIIDFSKNGISLPFGQTWSPDGKWITFYVFSDSPDIGMQGPYLMDASCLSDDTTCPGKIILKIDSPYSQPSWTPDSNLALFESASYSVNIYRMPSFSLIQEIAIPRKYWGLDNFTWSHNDEWFAVGGTSGIFIVSSKTGEIRQVSQTPAFVLFWIEIK